MAEPSLPVRPAIDLRPLFAPRSIAVVGATPRGWLGATVRDNLRAMGSETRCYFVNPKYEEVSGQRCYPTLGDLPERPDTVILAVNPLRATRFTQEAADAGIPSLVIPGGGVVEGGEAAAEMQRQVAEIATRHGIALLGPNCMGMVDWTTNSTNYIGDVNPWLPRGHVAALAQSGSVTDAFIHAPGRGSATAASCRWGSEVVLDLCDYLAYCLDDPETHAVMLFVEGFKRPERFLALCDRALALGKPIMAVKVGRSTQAQAAAIAHSRQPGGRGPRDRCRTRRGWRDPLRATSTNSSRLPSWWRAPAGSAAAWGSVAPAWSRCPPARRRSWPIWPTGRESTCRRCPSRRARPSSATCRRWATSATRSTRGARRTPRSRTGRRFEALAAVRCL